MKKLNIFLAGIISLGLLASCEKQKHDDAAMAGPDMLKSWSIVEMITPSTPDRADGLVDPVLIPGDNRGGNRTCADVYEAFGTEFVECGEKVDYDEHQGFLGSFPEWLDVDVDNGLLSFTVLAGAPYSVGAVIIKGSNAANVYHYGEAGVLHDEGLSAPEGHMISNVSFCCVEGGDIPPDFVIALKSYVIDDATEPDETWAVSDGTVYPDEILGIGYNNYVSGIPASYRLLLGGASGDQVGTIDVRDYFDVDGHWLEVTLTLDALNSWMINEAWHLYVGSKPGLDAYLFDYVSDPSKDILRYYSFPFGASNLGLVKSDVVLINYASIIE